MRRGAGAFVVVLLAAASCARAPAPGPEREPGLRATPADVELGAPFRLEARRARGEAAAKEWPEQPFPGVRLAREEASGTEPGAGPWETRTWTARAFTLESELRLIPPEGTAGGTIVRVVLPLDPQAPGDWELPADPLLPAHPGRWLGAALAAVAAASWLARRRAAARARAAAPPPPRPALGEGARAALARLRADAAAGALADREFHRRLAAVLRAAAAERGLARPEARTREELGRAWRAAGAPGADSFDEVFAGCDLVQFARASSGEEEREARLRRAAAVLEAGA